MLHKLESCLLDLLRQIQGHFHGQVGQSSDQPVLVKHVPVHFRGVGLDDF